jgi:hypothetical protein
MDPLTQARDSYQQSAGQANEAQAYGSTLPDMLKEALTKKFSTNNPLVADREGKLTNYMNSVTQAPLNVTSNTAGGNANVVYNPLQQANLIQQYRSAPLSALTTSNYLLGLNQGGIQNVIDATGRAYGAGTQRLLGEADIKHNIYNDLFNEAQQKAQQDMEERKFQEQIRQFDTQENRLSSNASSSTPDYSFLTDLLGGGGSNASSSKPMYSPATGNGSFSKDGQWAYYDGEWLPVTD